MTGVWLLSMVRPASGEGKKPLICMAFASVESMANDAREGSDQGQPPEDEAALSARLRSLNERLGQIQAERQRTTETRARSTADASAIARGLRLSAELVAGVLFGAALGWLLDRWLGTSPWALIVFLMLGFAGGVLSVLRSAGLAQGGPPDGTRDDS